MHTLPTNAHSSDLSKNAGIFGIWKDPVLNLGLGLFLFSQFAIRVGNESLAFQRCLACWELFVLYYIIMMGSRVLRLLLAPLDIAVSLLMHGVAKTTDDDPNDDNNERRFQLVLFPLLCKCEFGKVGDYFLSLPWYKQYYQTLASLLGGGRWLVSVFFQWYYDNYDEVQRAEIASRREAGWTGLCFRSCCCCCCRPGELNPVVSSWLAVNEELFQNAGGILISYAILQREYPSDGGDGDDTSLRQAAETRAQFSFLWGILSTIVETCYLVCLMLRVFKERKQRLREASNSLP